MMKERFARLAVFCGVMFVLSSAPLPATGQDSPSATAPPRPERRRPTIATAGVANPGDAAGLAANAERDTKFAQYMTGASLKGRFTINGKADAMPEETYTISACEKLPEGNLYRFTSRIQYGDTDNELPLEIPVEWAGDTPVISLTNMWIPGMGTFSARVTIYQDSYAGVWQHGEVGGQMFGVIVKPQQVEAEPQPQLAPEEPKVSPAPID